MSFMKCVSQHEIAKKIAKVHYFWTSRSFKVIDVGIPGKPLSSACYDKQQVPVCLQPFSRYRRVNSGNITISS